MFVVRPVLTKQNYLLLQYVYGYHWISWITIDNKIISKDDQLRAEEAQQFLKVQNKNHYIAVNQHEQR